MAIGRVCLRIHGQRCLSYSTLTKKTTVPVLWDYREGDDNDSCIKEAEAVRVQLLSWGRGASGQLGGGIEEVRMYPTAVASLCLTSQSVGISCGLFHSALTVNGRVWVWGKGDGGRLGLGHENPMFVPTLNANLASGWIKSVALGGLHSVALDSLGQVFTWGYGGFGALGHSVYTRELVPRLVEGPWNQEMCSISTGGAHTAAITKSGELYTWGRDEGDGRLGLGPGRGPDETGGMSIPTKVKALPVPVAAVSCGGFFTMALSEDGQLWSWGANSNYELGRGDRVGGWKPQPVPSLQDVRIIQIACGGYHSIALTDKGEVLSWGHGGRGQLGHSFIGNQKIPMQIEALANERVIQIACGGSSAAAVTDKGKLYMWGNAEDCQLGVSGLPEVQFSPVEVKFLTEDDGSVIHGVFSVSIGASHAMCLARISSAEG